VLSMEVLTTVRLGVELRLRIRLFWTGHVPAMLRTSATLAARWIMGWSGKTVVVL
jgi:hypothetical protein